MLRRCLFVVGTALSLAVTPLAWSQATSGTQPGVQPQGVGAQAGATPQGVGAQAAAQPQGVGAQAAATGTQQGVTGSTTPGGVANAPRGAVGQTNRNFGGI